MTIFMLFAALTMAPVTPPAEPPMTPWPAKVQPVQGCCKTCHKGYACGDSCISRNKKCHKGQGCACDG